MSALRPPLYPNRLCSLCLRRLLQERRYAGAKPYSSVTAPTLSKSFLSQGRYFWDNNTWRSAQVSSRPEKHQISGDATALVLPFDRPQKAVSLSSDPNVHAPGDEAILPHRRKKRRKEGAVDSELAGEDSPLPFDASSQLGRLAAESPADTLRRRGLAYLSLAKPRLSFLIVLTTTASYSLFPVAVSPMASSMDLSPITLLTLTTGTALASASANAFNMLLEPTYDAKMSRTRSRPLVRGLLSPQAALVFAICTGSVGVIMLYYGVNTTTAFLGAANILIYAGIYTPLKRISIWNTWVGAIVGGIPPLMGWAAAAGQATPYADATWQDLLFPSDGSSVGGWLLAALLFAWQFPHFWALAYPIRREYAAAGYRMLVSYDVRRTARIALRYSAFMFPICTGLSYTGVTSWLFVPTSSIANGWLVRESWQYLKHEGARGSARGLFWASVWHLPVVLVLAMIMKKGLWERFIQGGLNEEELRAWQSTGQERCRATRTPDGPDRDMTSLERGD